MLFIQDLRRFKLIFIFRFPIVIFLLGSLLYCAYKVAPSGGPEDKIPPEIIGYFPPKDSVGISSLSYVEIEFSETIRQTTLPNNYWIIPALENDLEVKWKGSKKVRFYLKDSLEKDQTYVFTLGTEVKDMRNNGLTSPFQIAFSSGDELDQGLISGRVFSDRLQSGVYINAYLLGEAVEEDSLIFQKPRYYTQIDKDGFFILNYLQMSRYRLIALLDGDYSGIYTMEADQIGLPFLDIQLDSAQSEFNNLNFYLIQEDTTGPRIVGLDTLPNGEIQVEFSEEIRLDDNFRVEIIDTVHNETYPMLGFSFDQQFPTFINLFLSSFSGNTEFSVRLEGITDLAGNAPKTSPLFRRFSAPAEQDTTPPKFLGSNPDSRSTGVTFDTQISLNFNVPVDTHLVRQNFKFQDTTSLAISGKFQFLNLRKPLFEPDGTLGDETVYEMVLNLAEIRDIWQRPFPDTLMTIRFTTQSKKNLGEISGQLFAPNFEWKQAILEASPLRGQAKYQLLVQNGESYMFNDLPDGLYQLHAILDLNENSIWDKGKTNPWTFAEPFIFRSDTIKVRKRWTTEGIDFNFNFGSTHEP
ncbi:MAG: Ig-like domain-containing protein [bacterium]|nr:MAG: Ig-like domain-containing protein [bacterium]